MKYTTISAMMISSTMMPVMRFSSRLCALRARFPFTAGELSTRSMRLRFLAAGAFATLFMLSALPAFARGAPPSEPTVIRSEPERARLPAVRIDDTLKSYGAWLDQLAASNRVAGLATAVIVDDKVRLERTLGYADAQTGEKVQPDTAFRLASLSKAFATALTGILVREGVLRWDTRLSDVLPFFQLKDADGTAPAAV